VKLIDTTVAIDHLRGSDAAVALLRRLIDQDEAVFASEVVRFELLAGVRDDELNALEQFFSALSWLAVDESVTRAAGALAREHRKAHSGIDNVDYLIAATTLILDAELLTTNVRHFPMLPDLQPPYLASIHRVDEPVPSGCRRRMTS
jgi:predicted nucleic acid-binding protein